MTSIPLLTLQLRDEAEVVLARDRAREIARLVGFEALEQTRVATAVSEIARNAFRYGRDGRIEFSLLQEVPQALRIRVADEGRGIADLAAVLEGRFVSSTGMGIGIVGARRLMDGCEIDSAPGRGTTVLLAKRLPRALAPTDVARIAEALARRPPQSPLEEIRRQNDELVRVVGALEARQAEVERLNRELDDTNHGVMALYSELDDKAEALRRASEVKSRFLSYMSHEFRTPLNSILSLSRLLLDRMDGDLGEEQEKQVTFIRRSAESLLEMVNDLLDLAKIEAGKTEVRPARFEAEELLGGLRGLFRPLLASEAVSLVFDPADGLPPLYTDEGKVAQILRNYISNALKFTERGEVRVTARAGDGETIVFAVQDTGIGIPPAEQERIFEEFTQVESRLQRQARGTGLGLPLSRGLAELMGGTVSVESVPGEGSTFFLRLPRVLPGATEPREDIAERSSGAGAARRTLVVIDDDEVARYLTRSLATECGYAVLEAENGADGLALVRRERPAAVLLDLVMPEMGGLEVLDELKGDPTTRDLPVIVMTSKVLNAAEKERLAGGTAAVLSKGSTSREETLAQLRAALGKAGLHRRGEKEA